METRHVRACTNCVRAKAKCSSSNTGDSDVKCERYARDDMLNCVECQLIENCRCLRMNKVCQPSPPMRRNRLPKRPYPQDSSRLEEKLDGLVTLLTSAAKSIPAVTASTTNTSPESLTFGNGSLTPSSVDGTAIDQGENSKNKPFYSGSGIPGFECTPRVDSSALVARDRMLFDPRLEPSHEDAELYLDLFRLKFVKNFPFIVLPNTIPAAELRHERPLLWLSIMTVASNKSTEQVRLTIAMREIFAREVFLEASRNMDLLLAILVYISW